MLYGGSYEEYLYPRDLEAEREWRDYEADGEIDRTDFEESREAE
jgi:hypothetical protein